MKNFNLSASKGFQSEIGGNSSPTLLSYSDFEDLLDKHLECSSSSVRDKRWYCPSCGGSNVTASQDRSKLGAISCWSGNCSPTQIFKAAGDSAYLDYADFLRAKNGEPALERKVFGESKSKKVSGLNESRKIKKPLEAKDLISCPELLPAQGLSPVIDEKEKVSPRHEIHAKKGFYIAYDHLFYRDGFNVQRQEFPDSFKKNGKRKKEFYPLQKSASFFTGWEPYRGSLVELGFYRQSFLEDSLQNPELAGNTVFILEGELSCDWFTLGTGWCSLTLPTALRNEDGFLSLAQYLKSKGLTGIYISDSDEAGISKLTLAVKAFKKAQCPLVGITGTAFPKDVDDLIKELFSEKQIQYSDNALQGKKEVYQMVRARIQEVVQSSIEAETEARTSKPSSKTSGQNSSGDGGEKKKRISTRKIIDLVLSEHRGRIKYCARDKQWYLYQDEIGIWEETDQIFVDRLLSNVWTGMGGDFPTVSQCGNLRLALKIEVTVKQVEHPGNLIGFRNGVLNKVNNEFKNHCESNNILWILPYDFNPIGAKSRIELIAESMPVVQWLHQAMGSGKEDLQKVNVAIAYLAAIVRGRVDLQRYLECIGPAGSGKGTFLRLAQAVIGRQNTCATSFERLEKGRFEGDRMINSRLVLITDADKWIGDAVNLKAFTGEDLIPIEKKGVQAKQGDDRAAKGMLIVAGEHSPNSTDSGGVKRRRITLPFNSPVSVLERRNLIKITPEGILEGDLAPYLPAFFSLILSYTQDEITKLVGQTEVYAPALLAASQKSLLDTSPLARWIDSNCYYKFDPFTQRTFEVSTKVGQAKKDLHSGGYVDSQTLLFANYKEWAEANGVKPVASNVFTNSLLEMMNHILRLPVTEAKSSTGGKIIEGLGLRVKDAPNPYPLILSDYVSRGVEDLEDEKKKGVDNAIALTPQPLYFPMAEAIALLSSPSQTAETTDTEPLQPNRIAKEAEQRRETPDTEPLELLSTNSDLNIQEIDEKEIDKKKGVKTPKRKQPTRQSDSGASSNSSEGVPASPTASIPPLSASASTSATFSFSSDSGQLDGNGNGSCSDRGGDGNGDGNG